MDQFSKGSLTKTIGIGVIGGGYWGKNLIRVFNELGVLKGICDLNKELIKIYKEKNPFVFCTNDPIELIEKKDIDAVVVATPASTHYEIAKIALNNEKHVFCEKPLALTEKEGAELVEIANKNKVVLMVGHILHYHPAVVKLKEIVRKGELGEIFYIYSHRTNIGRIRHEENILWSFAPHDISLILSLSNCLPEHVFAHGGIFLPHNVDDITLTFMTFPGKLKAHIFVSWLNPFKEQKFVVIGAKKMAVFDDTQPERKLVLYQHKISWNNGEVPTIEKADAEVINVEKTEPLKEEAKHFLKSIIENKKPLTDGEEGLNVLKVLEMAETSLRRKNE
ncbi:MAG: Gfo/Idh/MocA family oxidoreductase [Candidatus Omnitrophica bacterium]|nr:Gfo/Idh/MocA family oxidoreductase [Candidatus Omnitrophota bacterium]